ncbi:MAG: MBL fold metallo-hydrolase [Chloroflexi bacterium]|nr:MBL fold metallo-hydrolase [Chloroflexota bacterium]
MTVRLRFLGGVGVIGSTKILLEQDGWRVLLDLGNDIPSSADLLRYPALPRPARGIADRLRLGVAPRIDHLYRVDALEGTDVAGGADGHTVVFLSHAHIDHVGLAGWVDPAVPVYAAAGTVRVLGALEEAGTGLEGGRQAIRPLEDGETVHVGPFDVTCLAVDHDVPGAAGFLVTTADGTLAYTGDLRFHGRHPELSEAFTERVRGVRVLVTEGTMLAASFGAPFLSEADVDAALGAALDATPGLVVVSLYPRNTERAAALLRIADAAGRRVIWPVAMGRFLRAYGLEGVLTWEEGPGLEAIRANPARFVVQLGVDEIPRLLDLPLGPGALFVHSNGEPLGPFDPNWALLADWLAFLGLPMRVIGSAGHATPHDLERLVRLAAPRVVVPVHTNEPYRLAPPPGTARVLAERGREYALDHIDA